MSVSFDPRRGLVVVRAELEGPSGRAILRLALDTGATSTVVNAALLVSIGYDPALAPERVQITTGSGVEFAPRLTVSRVVALGQAREGFPILCHTLPPSSNVDGLLGLDFFRQRTLTIDFRVGQVELS
ncbi:MAG TPA: retropepsin-like aspartic protease [Longimicrobiaceae bacterium]|nr:retropepsin-like aspartic protease [Longimicrobiaceae bacterium]